MNGLALIFKGHSMHACKSSIQVSLHEPVLMEARIKCCFEEQLSHLSLAFGVLPIPSVELFKRSLNSRQACLCTRSCLEPPGHDPQGGSAFSQYCFANSDGLLSGGVWLDEMMLREKERRRDTRGPGWHLGVARSMLAIDTRPPTLTPFTSIRT